MGTYLAITGTFFFGFLLGALLGALMRQAGEDSRFEEAVEREQERMRRYEEPLRQEIYQEGD